MNKWSVDFSSALYNRTGKFFIGRDIICDQALAIEKIYYWRLPRSRHPTGVMARCLGRAITIDQALQASPLSILIPAFRPSERMLHLDPFTVLHARLERRDAVLCHDLGPITHPDLFGGEVAALYAHAYARIAAQGCRMVFVSNASADAFARHYDAPADGRVIYPPLRRDLDTVQGSPVREVDTPFLLTVGSIGRRKNQASSIAAYAKSGLWAQGMGYVLCGAREPGSDAVDDAARATPGVTLLPYVTDTQLAWLYDTASGFVLMSLLEGFGVPVAEAIARGLVPLVSAGGVLCEVAGDGALVADPHDIEQIAAQMVALASLTPPEREARQNRLRASLDRFTPARFRNDWQTMMSETA